MKRSVLRLLRASRLLPAADRVNLGVRRLVLSRRNRAEARAHPHFVYPPDELAFDAYGHVDKALYRESGRRWAVDLAALIADGLPEGAISVLDFGCGPARVLRPLAEVLSPRKGTLAGCDVNQRSVEWVVANLAGVRVFINDPLPPLDAADRSYDVVHAFSVFSHLSHESERSWIVELGRVLKPGGLLIITTQGQSFCERLASPDEKRRFLSGERITLAGQAEGRKWFLALHPPLHVRREMLRDFERVRQVRRDDPVAGRQDVWLARKPSSDASGGCEAR